MSERRPPKDPPRPPQTPRTTDAPPELFGAIVTSEKAVPVAKPAALPPSAKQQVAAAHAPPPPTPAPARPAPAPVVEELDASDFEEIEEVEVVETATPSIIPVATNPSLLPPAPASAHKDKDARVVLVVEDDASIRALIVRALGLSYTVYEADDGITAKHVLSRIPAPACIVSDWMMPRMDGLALLKSLRADPNMKWTPVVMLTAKNAPMEVLEGINSGARGYIAKPFKMKELLDKVATVIGKK